VEVPDEDRNVAEEPRKRRECGKGWCRKDGNVEGRGVEKTGMLKVAGVEKTEMLKVAG